MFRPESLSEDHSQWWWLEEKAAETQLPDLDGEDERELWLYVVVDWPIPNMGLEDVIPGDDAAREWLGCMSG